jgi:CHAT domain-containing protein/tetratricopeptide (TPR) repeat protein
MKLIASTLVCTIVVLLLMLRTLAPADAADDQQAGTPATTADDGDGLYKKALDFRTERKLNEALDAARASLEARERLRGADHADVAMSLNLLGQLQFELRDLSSAELAFERALRIRRAAAGVEPQQISNSLNNLSQVYLAQNRLRDAEPLLVESATILEKSGAPPAARAVAYNNTGGLLYRRGDFAAARDQFLRALDLWQQEHGPDHQNVATALNNAGLARLELGEAAEADAAFRKSVAIREKAGDSLPLARALQNLASAVQQEGRLAEAESLYARALAMFEKLNAGQSADAGQAMNNLAVLYLLSKAPERAGPLYERALSIREKALGPDHPDVATSLMAYSVYLHDRNRIAEAVEATSRATAIIERNVAIALEIGSESQKERYLQLYADGIDVTMWLRSRAGSAPADRVALLTLLRRKGRIQEVLAASTDALRTRGGSAAADLTALARPRAEYARLVLQAPTDQQTRALGDLRARLESLEGRVGAVSTAGRTVSIESVQSRVPDRGVLIEFFKYRPFDPTATRVTQRFGPPRYVAVALTRDGRMDWKEFGEADPIDQEIAAFRAALLNPRRTDVMDRGRALGPLVTTPLLGLAANAERLLIAPDGDLNLLPFQALVTSDGRYLVEDRVVTYLTSGRELDMQPATKTPTAPVIVANPAFGPQSAGGGAVSRSFQPLPGSRDEARALQEVVAGARLLVGPGASEAAVKELRAPTLLHIATHGFFLSDAPQDVVAGTRALTPEKGSSARALPPLLRSGLALARANTARPSDAEDGILTASETALLDLQGTHLVFLSACESGLGVVNAGESVYGLRRAFVIAGSRSQVLTLWQVSDRGTRTFVADFYRRLKDGADRSVALRDAQRNSLKDPARRHPFFWAAFILSGESGPLAWNVPR